MRKKTIQRNWDLGRDKNKEKVLHDTGDESWANILRSKVTLPLFEGLVSYAHVPTEKSYDRRGRAK